MRAPVTATASEKTDRESRRVARPEPRDIPLRGALRPRGPVRFEIREAREGEDGTVLHMAGELDLLTAPKLAAHLDDLLRRPRGEVIVDLDEVEFIDSAGLHVLLNAQRRLAGRARSLSVICPPGPVRREIELARLVETLGVRSTRAPGVS